MKKKKQKTSNTERVVSDIVIESYVPISPPLGGRRSKYRPVAEAMKPGDSVNFVSKRAAQALRFVICNVHGVGAGLTRKLDDGSYRIWRIQ